MSTDTRRRTGRRTLFLIVGLLALPFVLATLLWTFDWQPARRINHGELLPLSETSTVLKPSDLLPAGGHSPWLGHWTLAVAVPKHCDADCLSQLRLARQIQVSLNRDMRRLRRALIGAPEADLSSFAEAARQWPDLGISRLSAPAWPQLAVADGPPRLYVIDPQGRPILRYPPLANPVGVRRDLERLLKYSWEG